MTWKAPHGILAVLAAFVLSMAAMPALAAAQSDAAATANREVVAWRTGADFRNQLAANVGVKWVDNPLRQGLANLGRSQGVAILLDRRVDPGKKVTIAADEASLEGALRDIAAELDLGLCIIDAVVYIGPKPTAARLPTLAMLRKDEARKLPASYVKRLAERKPLVWEALATPRELLTQTLADIPAQSLELAFFPHDLWPAGDWPPLSAVDRLTLLLAGFDLTFELVLNEPVAPPASRRGRTAAKELLVRILPMPSEALARREYRTSGDSAKAAERLSSLVPAAQITIQRGKLEILASAEDHAAIDRLLRGAPPERPRGSTGASADSPPEKRYTLKTPLQPFGGVAKALGKQLGLEVAFDPAVEPRLAELVSIEVREATLAELLDALVRPLGLSYILEGKMLRISTK